VNETVTNSWATFPSDYRSSSGEVRFRLIVQPPDRRDVVKVNAIVFKAG
jgi:hypothetical protein